MSSKGSLSHPLRDTIKSKCFKQDLIKITQPGRGHTGFHPQSGVKCLEDTTSH